MATETILLAFFLFMTIAALYSSVGHAGASGYLAIMALLPFATDAIKPTSLILNCVVALIASIKFIRAGWFDRKVFLPLIVTSLPMAFVGGSLTIGPAYFKLFAGFFLIISAVLLVVKQYFRSEQAPIRPLPLPLALVLGAVIGLLSGLIGVGGGIFLSPILLMGNWATVRNASGVAALFILCNSLAGLAGQLAPLFIPKNAIPGLVGQVSALSNLDHTIFFWLPAVVVGGLIGSYFGTQKFNNHIIIGCLFLVLLSAGLKFVLVDFGKV